MSKKHGASKKRKKAAREWKSGTAFGGRVKVTPEVQAAAAAADAEWERLKASHH